MLEKWTEKLLEQSFFMKALRASTTKAIRLGMVDALENSSGVPINENEASSGAEVKISAVKSTPPGPAIALPRPQLLGIAGKGTEEDEPDRPGVPSKRLRRKRSPGTELSTDQQTPSDRDASQEGGNP